MYFLLYVGSCAGLVRHRMVEVVRVVRVVLAAQVVLPVVAVVRAQAPLGRKQKKVSRGKDRKKTKKVSSFVQKRTFS